MNYKYGIKHYWDYFKECLNISNKRVFEYKVNVINILLVHLGKFVSYFVFVFALISQFGSIINWDVIDGLLFILVFDICYFLIAHLSFSNGKYLNRTLRDGSFTLLLFKPGNIFFNYALKIHISTIFYIINSILTIIVLIVFYEFSIIYFIISIPFMLIISLVFIITFWFIDSFNFYFIDYLDFTKNLYLSHISENFYARFPMQLFQNSILFSILKVSPLFYISTLIIPIIRYGNFHNISNFIFVSIIISIISIIGIIINWKYGLKRYEAYG